MALDSYFSKVWNSTTLILHTQKYTLSSIQRHRHHPLLLYITNGRAHKKVRVNGAIFTPHHVHVCIVPLRVSWCWVHFFLSHSGFSVSELQTKRQTEKVHDIPFYFKIRESHPAVCARVCVCACVWEKRPTLCRNMTSLCANTTHLITRLFIQMLKV